MTKVKPEKISKAEVAELRKRLRYMNPRDIAKDFKSSRERAAIAAVLKWLSFSGCVAWRQKRPGTYSTTMLSKSIRRKLDDPWHAIVVDRSALDLIEKVFKKDLKG